MPRGRHVRNNAEERARLVAALRQHPRSSTRKLTELLDLSTTAVVGLLGPLIQEGTVRWAREWAMKFGPRVFWHKDDTPAAAPEPDPDLEAAIALPTAAARFPIRGYPYAHTGTPIDRAGLVQRIAIAGKTLPPIGRSK